MPLQGRKNRKKEVNISREEVNISRDEILITENINFRDGNAQIKTSVISQRALFILKKKHFFLMGIQGGKCLPPPVRMPLQKGKGANCKYITLTEDLEKKRGIYQK